MPKLQVQKSIDINAPREEVFALLADYHNWKAWSPWLIMEPEAKLDVAENGKSYSWEGKLTGKGSMTTTLEQPPERMECDLEFLTPWKSQSKVHFILAENNGQTKVTWEMDGNLPFFLFFMKGMMQSFVGMDYERGLRMLKDLLETGSVPSELEKTGAVTAGGFDYVGIKTVSSMEEMSVNMERDFAKLETLEGIESTGSGFCQYHKWDMGKKRVEYTAGMPVKRSPADLPEGFTRGHIPITSAYAITHIGDWKHLGNAWSTGMTLSRNKVFKQNKRIHPFETYDTMPTKTEQAKTVVYFPTVS